MRCVDERRAAGEERKGVKRRRSRTGGVSEILWLMGRRPRRESETVVAKWLVMECESGVDGDEETLMVRVWLGS